MLKSGKNPAIAKFFKGGCRALALSAFLALTLFGGTCADAEDIVPALGEDSAIRFVEGTSSNYNFITKDSDGTKYWLIQFNTNKLSANNVEWSTSEISGFTGKYDVTLPNGKTTFLYYKYTQPSGYSNAPSRITNLTSTNAQNKIFQNFSGSTAGSAIYNSGSGNYNITADFINNSINASSQYQWGTSIYNSGTINKISGYFNSNKGTSNDVYNSMKGAAIANSGKINDVDGVFINNYTSGPGANGAGAIFNNGTIGNLHGLFINNYGQSTDNTTSEGGAIQNEGGKITTINGTFLNNYTKSKKYADGGAIGNNGSSSTITNILGTFINNHTENSNSSYFSGGGAIHNSGSVSNIVGDFIGNYSTSTSNIAQGGAINTTSTNTIAKISGNFIGNYTQANSNYSMGGAIYNKSVVSNVLNSNFIDNYAQTTSTSGTVQGGAIWTNSNITFNSTDGFNSRFSGNYVQKGTSGTRLSEAIYVNSSSATLTFNATTNGQYTFDDYFNGVSNYKVTFTGDSTGKVNLYNDVKNGAVTTNTITMNLANDEIHNYLVYSLNSNTSTKWNLDVNLNNKTADNITTSTSTTSSRVTLDDINFFAGDISSITPSNFKIKILNTQNSNLQLALSTAAQAKYSTEYELYSEGTTTYDTVQINTNWDKIYNKHVAGTTVYGTLGLATTSTTNDSIGVTVTRVVSGESTDTPMGDTLALVNQSDLSVRNFNTSDASDSYTLSSTLGNTAAGTLSINGATENNTHSTLNLNGKDSFNLTENTTLNLNDVKLTGNSTVVNVSNENAQVNIADSFIDGAITGSKKFALKTSGITTLNSTVTNADYTNEGTVIANGTISGTILNKSGATLNIAANNIDGTVTNHGTLNFISGTNTHEINGTGATITTGAIINNALINQAVTNTGTLTSSANNLSNAILNTGTLNLSGTLSNKTITGEGTTNIDTALTFAANSNIDGTLDMNSGTLTVSPDATTTHNVGSVKGNGNLVIDVNAQTNSSDVINITNGTKNGNNTVLTIATLNLTKPTISGDSGSYTKQILTGNTTGVTLALSNNVINTYNKVTPLNESDTDTLNINTIAWDDVYGGWTRSGTQTECVAIVSSSGTLQDSIEYSLNKEWGEKNYTSKTENLASINTYSGADSANRTMNFDGIFEDTTAQGTYTVKSDLGISTAGNLTLNGEKSGQNNTTINLNTHNGFILENATTLNIKNIDIGDSTKSVANTTIANVTNSSAVVNLENVTLNGNITGSGFNVGTSGTTILNGSVGGNVTNSGSLYSSLANIGGTVTNNNIFYLSGNLTKDIAGENGTTVLLTTTNVDSNKTVAGTLNLNSNTLEMNDTANATLNVKNLIGNGNLTLNVNAQTNTADAIHITDGTNNNSQMTITSLNLTKPTVSGDSGSYTRQILTGNTEDVSLILSENVKNTYNIVTPLNNSGTDYMSNTIAWNDVYGGWIQTGTQTEALEIVGSSDSLKDSIKYSLNKVWNAKEYTAQVDNLSGVNKYINTGSEARSMNFAGILDDPVAQGTYKVSENIGVTAAGNLTLYGEVNGNTRSVLDFDGHSGFELNNDGTTVTISNMEITGATSLVSANGLSSDNSIILDNVKLHNNGTGILTFGNVQIKGNSTISDNIVAMGTSVDVDAANEVTLDSAMTGSGTTTLSLHDGTVNLTELANISAFGLTLKDTSLNIANESSLAGLNTTFNGTNNLNMANGSVGTLALGSVNLNGLLKMQVDADLANKQMDQLTATSATVNGGNIEVSKINLLSATTDEKTSLLFTNNSDLANAVNYTGEGEIAYSPIFRYKTSYSVKDGEGYFDFVLPSQPGPGPSPSPTPSDFNPAVLTTPTMTQAGMMANMNATMNYAFQHSDGFTKLSAMDRFAAINANKYALAETGSGTSTDFNQNMANLAQSYENKGAWVRPYASFENIGLKNGPRVDAISYGTLVGFDTDFKELRNGWDTVFTGYVGYNGAHLNYTGVTTTMNGGMLGGTQTWYKGNFWTALTATTGASVAENDTMYGHDSNVSLMTGIGSKTGYNFEFADGKFIVQPIWFMNYSMIKTFDYTNAAGVRIDSDPLHTIQLNPSVRLIGNLKHGWQPYASVGMVWNLMNQTKAHANGVKLPEMSVKPYVEYGVGVQKQVGDRFTGFFQAMMRNGGRNGIALTGGFRWALGRDSKPVEKVQGVNIKQAEAASSTSKVKSDKKILNKVKNDEKQVQNAKLKNKSALKSRIDRFFAKMNGEPLL